MTKVTLYALDGIRSYQLTKHADERGFFAERLRQDWAEFLGNDLLIQTGLSVSHPGVVRAWHRHNRGQVDYMVIVDGKVKIAAYDDAMNSPTKGQLVEIVASGEELQAVRIPGHYWHGTKNIGSNPSTTLYFFTRLYDYDDPDEKRITWNDPTITNPRTGLPYDWDS